MPPPPTRALPLALPLLLLLLVNSFAPSPLTCTVRSARHSTWFDVAASAAESWSAAMLPTGMVKVKRIVDLKGFSDKSSVNVVQ